MHHGPAMHRPSPLGAGRRAANKSNLSGREPLGYSRYAVAHRRACRRFVALEDLLSPRQHRVPAPCFARVFCLNGGKRSRFVPHPCHKQRLMVVTEG